MTTPLDQAIAAVQALAAGDTSALQAVQTQLAQVQLDDNTKTQLLTAAQSQLAMSQAQNVALAEQVAALTAEIAALQPATLWGASVSANSGETKTAAIVRIGKQLPSQIWRWYDDAKGPAALQSQMTSSVVLSSGASVLASFKDDPSSVTKGLRDSAIDPLLTALKTSPGKRRHRIAFWHEPEQSGNKGGTYTPRIAPADHKAANEHIRQRITATGSNVLLVLILTGFDFADRLPLYWDSIYDEIWIDPYASSVTQTPLQLVQPSLDIAAKVAPGVPLGIAEIGQPAKATDAQQATFIAGLAALEGKVVGCTWFDTTTPTTRGKISDTGNASAFKQIATMA